MIRVVEQAYATQLGTHTCACSLPHTGCKYLIDNTIINGGTSRANQVDLGLDRIRRCREAKAETVVVWLLFATFLVTGWIAWKGWRKGGIKYSHLSHPVAWPRQSGEGQGLSSGEMHGDKGRLPV